MKLTAFKIKNFRSIVDTGWQMLSHDNITSLIGQNESGKTSILEGIRAFYDGNLIEDMLRSDLSLPEVSCRFSFSISDFEDDIDTRKLDPKIRKEISKIKEILNVKIKHSTIKNCRFLCVQPNFFSTRHLVGRFCK